MTALEQSIQLTNDQSMKDTKFIKLSKELEETMQANNIRGDVADVLRISMQICLIYSVTRGVL